MTRPVTISPGLIPVPDTPSSIDLPSKLFTINSQLICKSIGEMGETMYFKQRDLFGPLGKDFVNEIMNSAETESHQGGEMLFHEGDPAGWFFILLKGRIKLSLGQTGRVLYVVSRAGELFGWSSLVGRPSYSASAECMIPTSLLRFDKNRLKEIIQKDAAGGITLFQNLAAILGNRLIRSYELNISAAKDEVYASAGTGQVMEVAETEMQI
jgi:hypothetical protein